MSDLGASSPDRIEQALLVAPEVLSDVAAPLDSVLYACSIRGLRHVVLLGSVGMLEGRETARDGQNVTETTVGCWSKTVSSIYNAVACYTHPQWAGCRRFRLQSRRPLRRG